MEDGGGEGRFGVVDVGERRPLPNPSSPQDSSTSSGFRAQRFCELVGVVLGLSPLVILRTSGRSPLTGRDLPRLLRGRLAPVGARWRLLAPVGAARWHPLAPPWIRSTQLRGQQLLNFQSAFRSCLTQTGSQSN